MDTTVNHATSIPRMSRKIPDGSIDSQPSCGWVTKGHSIKASQATHSSKVASGNIRHGGANVQLDLSNVGETGNVCRYIPMLRMVAARGILRYDARDGRSERNPQV